MITQDVLLDMTRNDTLTDIYLSIGVLKDVLTAALASDTVRHYVSLNMVLHLVPTLFATSRFLVFEVNF